MASNGGTLHGVPQPIHQPSPPGGYTCSQCGLLFDSGASLQVHMHYHHEQQQQQQQSNTQWQSPSSTHSGNNSPTLDHVNAGSQEGSNVNNNHLHLKHSKCISPPATAAMNGSSNTIAAADSSDNQPSTPSSMENGQRNNNGGAAAYPELGYYQQAAAYEQHYQPQYPTPGGEYPGSTAASNSNLMMQPPHEYKSAPSSRYHPYGSPVNSQQSGANSSPSTTTLNAASPRLVSSSSPSHNQHNQHLGQPTPSPSPKQCDKCGLVCTTASELNEHYVTAHASSAGEFAGNNAPQYPPFGPAPVKEEPACDILDLDSQKMVYPPHQNNNDPSLVNNNNSSSGNSEGPLPSMQSLHTIQRHHPHPVMWQPTGHDMYGMQQQQQQQQQRGEYGMLSPTIPPPAQTHLSSSPSSGGVPSIKSEYQPFDQSSSITTSPSDFPSTTTPQDSNNNNTSGQFRNFEPPTSSLPSAISSGKSTAWKSNEARRPKTYNCTACNKWFTSSGHLKRHYNTTLHKNAVKASNQPDPATMPISVHHHPARDPNSKHHRSNAGAQVGNTHPPPQPQPPPTDPQRSPDYAPQFAVSSATAGAYTNVAASAAHHHNQGFQQYSASLHSNAAIPPNGQAGPSVHASLPRGLLTYSNHHMEVQPQPQVQVLQHHIISSDTHTTANSNSTMPLLLARDPLSLSPTPATTTTHHLSPSTITTTQQLTPIISTSMEPPLLLPPGYISSPLDTTTTTITSPPLSRLEAIPQQLSYHTIIGSQPEDLHHLQPAQQSENTDGMLMASQHQQEDQSARLTLLAPSYTEYAVSSSANETYTIRVLANPQDIGDTAPYSPSMPHDPYRQQEPLPAMTTTGFHPRITYMQQPADVMMTLPKLAETAPDMCSSPGSPSVTSSDSVLMEQKPRVMPQQEGSNVVQMEFIKDGVKRYECVQCDKTFNKSCYLTQHNKTFHSGDKPFKCHRCGKRFSCDQSHEEHVAKHSGDKPFKCELCPKAFNHKTDLRRHMCLHSGQKPFHCEQCGKGFIRKDHLVKHMDVHTRKAEQMKRKLDQQQGDKGGKVKLEAAYEDDEDSMSLMM